MANHQQYTAAKIIKALQHTRGLVTLAAEHLGCSDETISNYAKRYPSVADELRRQRERVTDLAEQKLFDAIQEGQPWAINFYLKTIGKPRGYVERHEFTGKDGDHLHIHLSWGDASYQNTQDAQDPHANGGPPALTSGPTAGAPDDGAL